MQHPPPPPTPQRRKFYGSHLQAQASRSRRSSNTRPQVPPQPQHQHRIPPTFIPPATNVNLNAHSQSNTSPFAPNLCAGVNANTNSNAITFTQKPMTVLDLLPFCTSQGRLSQADMTNLGEVAGSLREVVLLSLQGGLDREGKDALEGAMGVEAASGVKGFWRDEWVVD